MRATEKFEIQPFYGSRALRTTREPLRPNSVNVRKYAPRRLPVDDVRNVTRAVLVFRARTATAVQMRNVIGTPRRPEMARRSNVPTARKKQKRKYLRRSNFPSTSNVGESLKIINRGKSS